MCRGPKWGYPAQPINLAGICRKFAGTGPSAWPWVEGGWEEGRQRNFCHSPPLPPPPTPSSTPPPRVGRPAFWKFDGYGRRKWQACHRRSCRTPGLVASCETFTGSIPGDVFFAVSPPGIEILGWPLLHPGGLARLAHLRQIRWFRPLAQLSLRPSTPKLRARRQGARPPIQLNLRQIR